MERKQRKEDNIESDIETIFQVRIDRQTGTFEYVKVGLSPFEQAAFEIFIRSYADNLRDTRNELLDGGDLHTDEEVEYD